jgi:predicted nucleotidyltransferase
MWVYHENAMSASRSVAHEESFLADVRLAWQQRREQQRVDLSARRERARMVADKMAAHLRAAYGATRVVLFGTVVSGNFHAHSDIDIAAWGIRDEDWSVAYSDIACFDREFEGDLVPMQWCKPHIAEEIERTGVDL